MLLESQTQAPAKGGEVAPYDIIIEKGPTAFPAGPIVGDFQTAGFPAAIEKGKIVIRKKHTAVAEGDIISAEVASALTKLEVYPITVGMQLVGAFDGEFDGVVVCAVDGSSVGPPLGSRVGCIVGSNVGSLFLILSAHSFFFCSSVFSLPSIPDFVLV